MQSLTPLSPQQPLGGGITPQQQQKQEPMNQQQNYQINNVQEQIQENLNETGINLPRNIDEEQLYLNSFRNEIRDFIRPIPNGFNLNISVPDGPIDRNFYSNVVNRLIQGIPNNRVNVRIRADFGMLLRSNRNGELRYWYPSGSRALFIPSGTIFQNNKKSAIDLVNFMSNVNLYQMIVNFPSTE